MSNDDNYVAVVLEIRDQNKALLEVVGSLKDTVKTLATEEELAEVKADVKIIRAVLTDRNRDMKDLDCRVTVLEQAA